MGESNSESNLWGGSWWHGGNGGTLSVTVDAVRTDESWPDFANIDVHFTYTGVNDDQAASYTELWNCLLYTSDAADE